MVTNSLFRQCLSNIPKKQKEDFEASFGIAEKLDEVLKSKGISKKELAVRTHSSEDDVSKWLTGRYHFSGMMVAKIERAVGSKLS